MDLYNLVVSAKLTKGGGGGDIDVDALTVTENGVYSASSGHAFSPVTVSVPQSGITPSGTSNITANGVYDVTNFASASVSVPVGVFPSGTSSITANGIYDITSFASVDVNVSGGGGGDHDAEDGIIDRTISGAYTNSRVTTIGSFALYSCKNLESINFPNVSFINSNAFTLCRSLTAASLPLLEELDIAAFASCNKLSSVYAPNLQIISSSAFNSCAAINTLSFPLLESIGVSAFRGCSNLMSLYLLSSSVVALNTGVFVMTPMSSSTYTGSFGSIYVPASLVDSYKSASNWSNISNRITSYVE